MRLRCNKFIIVLRSYAISYKFRLHTGFMRDVATAAKTDSYGWTARCEI